MIEHIITNEGSFLLSVRRRMLRQVVIEDQDRKSTCQSVNDPHVTTFDGL